MSPISIDCYGEVHVPPLVEVHTWHPVRDTNAVETERKQFRELGNCILAFVRDGVDTGRRRDAALLSSRCRVVDILQSHPLVQFQ